jgi:hypothetical protein
MYESELQRKHVALLPHTYLSVKKQKRATANTSCHSAASIVQVVVQKWQVKLAKRLSSMRL